MKELQEKGVLFMKFLFCLEAVDVMLQQTNRLSENMQEGKDYFEGSKNSTAVN